MKFTDCTTDPEEPYYISLECPDPNGRYLNFYEHEIQYLPKVIKLFGVTCSKGDDDFEFEKKVFGNKNDHQVVLGRVHYMVAAVLNWEENETN